MTALLTLLANMAGIEVQNVAVPLLQFRHELWYVSFYRVTQNKLHEQERN